MNVIIKEEGEKEKEGEKCEEDEVFFEEGGELEGLEKKGHWININRWMVDIFGSKLRTIMINII